MEPGGDRIREVESAYVEAGDDQMGQEEGHGEQAEMAVCSAGAGFDSFAEEVAVEGGEDYDGGENKTGRSRPRRRAGPTGRPSRTG